MSAEIDHYDYDLPRDLIAQYPLPQRADARLMVIDRARQSIDHGHIRDLPTILRPRDRLVLNDTRVLPARLLGRRTRTGGRWEGLFLAADEHGLWRVITKTRGRPEPEETVTLFDQDGATGMRLRLVAKLEGGEWAVKPESDLSTVEILEHYGRVPLPPYIRQGEMVESDRRNYQTVFARHDGAVAAPTAGLHFTEPLLEQLRNKDVGLSYVTLHVGIGTFRPVSVSQLDEHQMHSEWGSIGAETVEEVNASRTGGGRAIAIGTTAMRVLETAARGGQLGVWEGQTDLFIRPPFTFHATDGLLTNFHLPRSTLLVLVRTFGGDALLREAYQQAIEEEYRFYSYGDAMLIL